MPKLTVELVPASCWESNVRSLVKKSVWDTLRRELYAAAGNKCQICGRAGSRHAVEAHEIWKYDEAGPLQTLEGLIALCPACHAVKHIGLQQVLGPKYFERAVFHLRLMNGWDLEQALEYVDGAFRVWKHQSQLTWKQDLAWLTQKLNQLGVK